MSKNYSKTKTELVKICSDLIIKFGETAKFKCVKIKQQDEILMLTCPLPVNLTHLIFQRIPRYYDNPDGLQRALKQNKITSIEDLITTNSRYTSPNAVVANILIKNNKWAMKFYEDQHISGLYWIELNLGEILQKLENAEVDEDYIKNEEEVMLGFLIDAHHRTEGFYRAGKMENDLPVTLYIDLPRNEMAEVFVNINQFQEKPSPTHTLAMRAISNSLTGKEELSHQILTLLNESDWSILNNRIKVYDGPVPKGYPKPYVNASTFHNLIVKYMLSEIPETLTPITKADVISKYFTAWKEVFPTAWEDQSKHILVKSMGFQIMARLFEKIMILTSIRNGSYTPTKEQFVEIIKLSFGDNQSISIGEDASERITIPLNWSSKHYGAYSNGKGINLLTEVLKAHMTNNSSLKTTPNQ